MDRCLDVAEGLLAMHPLYARVRLHGHYYGQTSLVGTYLSRIANLVDNSVTKCIRCRASMVGSARDVKWIEDQAIT